MHLNPSWAVAYAILISVTGSLLGFIFGSNRRLAGWINLLVTSSAALFALYACVKTLVSGPVDAVVLFNVQVLDSSLRLYVDGLASIFLGLLAFVSFLASLYSVRYMDHYEGYSARVYYGLFQLFIAGMYGILTVTDLFLFFCFFWQVMTLASFGLIRFEHRNPANVRAAWVYLLMMEIACGLVMAAGWILAGLPQPAGTAVHPGMRFDFERFGLLLGQLPGPFPLIVNTAIVLFLIGFAVKAGLWPFGRIWLPDAHPAAPSPVSALLSGVMIKTGVYGLIRTFLWLLPSDPGLSHPVVWGFVLSVAGTVTLFSGTVQALQQEESKRLLAYHSIGQAGYIVLGLGACLMLLPSASTVELAYAGLFGCLFHTVNHGLFKSLLFLNAGTMLNATGTQDLNRLGGLMKYMPLTAVTALIASFSISGVPLFNGFASKWSLYVSTILGGASAAGRGAPAVLAIFGMFGVLTSVLTLASFVKFFGVSFLSRVSGLVAEKAARGRLEAGWEMQAPQVLLAVACILLGLFPAAAYRVFSASLSAGCTGLSERLAAGSVGSSGILKGISFAGGGAVLAPIAIFSVLAVLFLAGRFIARLGAAPVRKTDAWLCGYDSEADHHRFGAHNLYREIKHYLHRAGGRRKPGEQGRSHGGR